MLLAVDVAAGAALRVDEVLDVEGEFKEEVKPAPSVLSYVGGGTGSGFNCWTWGVAMPESVAGVSTITSRTISGMAAILRGRRLGGQGVIDKKKEYVSILFPYSSIPTYTFIAS